MTSRPLRSIDRARGVTAVLGPTNTGKTHLAIERMLGHASGMIGLPLRLLAREVYNRVVERVGADEVALLTGEEKIRPAKPRYWVATVEAMPRDLATSFVAIDEVQVAGDLARGHVFTERLLNMRGENETLIIGSAVIRPLVEKLLPGVNVVTRPRLSQLSFAGERKLTRLPNRSAVVAFSVEEVYAIAELMRRQRGGAAVVLGALSPRTRNAQVELFQNGDVGHLVATDAIGMGLNLDVDHVAFASDRKFDGFGFRRLTAAEFGQIAGRAGRHLRDGTFGTSGRCPPLEEELARAVEEHVFEPLGRIQWRNARLDFASLEGLAASLVVLPSEEGLTRAPIAEDQLVLEALARERDIRDHATNAARIGQLWEVCQIPDYRKVSPTAHADIVGTVFRFLMRDGRIGEDWFARQVASVDRTDGDIDTLSARIAQVRTWTFVANRNDWMRDPEHWQERTRRVEDSLSDALHERLTHRFVDRRTSVLMRRLREKAMLEAEVTPTGDVRVEGQHVGQLIGFQFAADAEASGPDGKALRAAATNALSGEFERRADRLSAAADVSFVLASDGVIRWLGEPVARISEGEKVLAPLVRLAADDLLAGGAREKVQARLDLWLKTHVEKLLGPLFDLQKAEDLTGMARGIAYQLSEAVGVIDRAQVANDVRALDPPQRAALRKHGVRIGAYHLYLPGLMKPAPRTLAAQLWALKQGGDAGQAVADLAHLAASGRTSVKAQAEIAKPLYRAAGFRVCGERAVRVDILERLADLVRPAIAYRPGETVGDPPPGAADEDGFVVVGPMTSLVGCSGEDFASILKSLGYGASKRAGPAITKPILKPARAEPVVVTAAVGDAAAIAASAEAPTGAGDATAAPAADVPLADPAPDAGSAIAASVSAEPVSECLPAAEPEPAAVVAEPPAPTAADAAGADAGHDVPAPEPIADPAPDPAPIEIEVWRLQRQRRERSERRSDRRGRPEDGQGKPRHGRPGHGKPGHDKSGHGMPHEGRGERSPRGPRPGAAPTAPELPTEGAPETAPIAAAGEAAAAPELRPARPERRPQREGERRPFREERRDRPGKSAKPGDRPGRPDRPERRDEESRDRPGRGGFGDRRREHPDARPPRVFSTEERRDKGTADPDSPFAKLAALKARLEGKS